MQIIGLAGASGSGKTTVAGMLAAELLDRGYTVKLDAFATPIKKRIMKAKELRALPPVVDKETDRVEMQRIGTKCREENPTLFIEYMCAANNLLPGWVFPREVWVPADFLIVGDVRFPNEAEYIRKRGVLIHVCGCRRPLAGEAARHESESHFAELMSGADYAIAGQPDLASLAVAVKALVDAGAHIKK